MRLEQYIINESSRSKPLDKETFEELLRTDYSDAAKALVKNASSRLYRGNYDLARYALTDPTKGRLRRSSNTSNEYTLFMDNNKIWNEYPNRGRSIICSTDMLSSEQYGDNGLVIPMNGTLLGQCNEFDLWSSFKVLEKSLDVEDMDDFNHTLRFLIGVGNDTNWRTLRKSFTTFDKKLKEGGWESIYNDIITKTKYQKEYARELVSRWEKIWKGSMMKTMEYLLDPKTNKFKLKKSGDKFEPNREVWVGGKALYVSLDYLDATSGDKHTIDYIKRVIS